MALGTLGRCQDCGHPGCTILRTPDGARIWLCGDCEWIRLHTPAVAV